MNTIIQVEFQPAIDNCFSFCQNRFGSRMISCYIAGSVGSGEAWAGYSDIDWWFFVENDISDSDVAWRKDCENELGNKFKFIKGFHLNCCSISALRKEAFWRFILKYNALHFWGTDIIQKIESEGTPIPSPNSELIKSRLWWVKDCAKGLNEGVFPDSLFANAIPSKLFEMKENDYQATRKIARNFVLTEGAYLLMTTGDFSSFKAIEILPNLQLLYPQWNEIFEMTLRIFRNPIEAAISPMKFAEAVKPYIKWMIEKMEN